MRLAVFARRLPLWQTVYAYFATWRDDGTLACLHSQLRAKVMAATGRQPQPTAAIIDSQSVRAIMAVDQEAAERVGEPVLRPE
jgi:transposase